MDHQKDLIHIPDHSHLYLMGDYHQQKSRLLAQIKTIPAESCVIVLGDLEAYHPSDLIELDKIATHHKAHFYIMRGNHDNPKFWQDRMWTGILNLHNITLLNEVDCLLWKQMKLITVNGAVSIDRTCFRFLEGKCWPKTEASPKDAIERVQALGSCDILITHTGNPSQYDLNNEFLASYASTDPLLIEDIKQERILIQKLQMASQCERHYYGHFHRSMTEEQFDVATRCLDICELLALT